jgi:hypothetical protein
MVRSVEEEEDELGGAVVEQEDQRGHEHDRDQHHDRGMVTSFLVGQATFFSSARTSERYWRGPVFSFLTSLPGAGRDLRSGAWDDRSPALPSGASSVGSRGPLSVIRCLLMQVVEQGRRDSNPQPPVLETGALPIELLPSGQGGPKKRG